MSEEENSSFVVTNELCELHDFSPKTSSFHKDFNRHARKSSFLDMQKFKERQDTATLLAKESDRKKRLSQLSLSKFDGCRRIQQKRENQKLSMSRWEIGGWKEIANGDLDFFRKRLAKNTLERDININEVGPFGESILHWALLQKQEEIAILLMKTYPWLIHYVYTEDPFIGEGTMHIAIANGMTKSVRKILEICEYWERQRRDCEDNREDAKELAISMNTVSDAVKQCWKYPLNDQVVTGIFFTRDHKDNQVYWGQHPLAFAVCRGNAKMVEILVKHRAKLDIFDSHQNSIVHLCVLFGHRHIFDQLIGLGKEQEKKGMTFKYIDVNGEGETCFWEKWITLHRNEKRYTALQAAVAWDKMGMFEHMLTYQRKDGWRWGPLAMYQYPLSEIDTHGLKNPNSVLEVIVSEGRRKFLDIAVIRDIFSEKWEQYGKYMFRFELCLYLFWVITLTWSAHSIDFREFDDPDVDDSEKLELSTTTLWLKRFTMVISILFLVVESFELKDLLEEHGGSGGLRIYFAVKSRNHIVDDKRGLLHRKGSHISISGVFKIMVWIRNMITIIALICTWIANRATLHVAFVCYLFAIIFAFFGLLEYFQLQKQAGRFVIMVLKILIRDVSVFMLVWVVILFGFACSFTLIREDKDFTRAFFFALETSLSFGEYANESVDFYDDALYRGMGMFIYVLFVLFSVVLLLNLLIAVMAETTQAIGERDINRLNFVEQWAGTVLKMERRVPAYFYKRTGQPQGSEPAQSNEAEQEKKNLFQKLFLNDARHKDPHVVFYVSAVEDLEKPVRLSKDIVRNSQTALSRSDRPILSQSGPSTMSNIVN